VVPATKFTATLSDVDGSEPRAWLLVLRFNGTEHVGNFEITLVLVAVAGTGEKAIYLPLVSVELAILVEELPTLVVVERSKSLAID
jgi:hypothetical protein